MYTRPDPDPIQTATAVPLPTLDEPGGLLQGRLMYYRGRAYIAPIVPALARMAFDNLMRRMDVAGTGSAQEDPQALIRENLRLLHRHLRPLARWGALPWWMRRNPFRGANVDDLVRLNRLFVAGSNATWGGPVLADDLNRQRRF